MARIGGGGRSRRSELESQHERGELGCTNCVVTVPQDKYYAVEQFGRFREVAQPGFAFLGPDLCGCCITLRSITTRTQEAEVRVRTKTMNMITYVNVTVQHSVDPQQLETVFYSLDDFPAQLESIVADAVQKYWPLYPNVDVVAETERKITADLAKVGILANKIISSYVVPPEVAEAQEMKAKYQRERDANIEKAEGEKQQIVKAAEAAADRMALKGEGLARERKAILDGMRASICEASGEDRLSQRQITELMVLTEYFETMKRIGNADADHVVFNFCPKDKSTSQNAWLNAPQANDMIPPGAACAAAPEAWVATAASAEAASAAPAQRGIFSGLFG